MILKSMFGAAAILSLAATPVLAQAPSPAPAAAPPAAAAAAPSNYTQVMPKGDIVQTLQGSGQFTTLLKIMDMTNLTGTLRRPQPITIFAPTDSAFAALPAGALSSLMQPANAAQLQARLAYHLFNGPLDYAQLQGKSGPIDSAAGGKIYVDGASTPNKVNDATLLQPNVKATNGFIYVVDKVLAPGFTPPSAPAEEPAAPAAPAAQ
jgi:uncharacterized surface protein with fasciclin (FAS1) repeats